MINRVLFLTAALSLTAPVLAEDGATKPPIAAASSAEGMVGPALFISNPDKSLKFYTKGLGMTLRMQFGPKDKPDMIVGFGKNPLDAGIMLLTDKSSPTPKPITHAHGFDRIALRVADLRTVNDNLRKAGFAPGEIQIVHGAIQMMMVTDPDGYRIELIDSKPAPRPK